MAQTKRARTRYATGVATVEQIIRAAEHVLVEKGHAALTLRAVADECGLQLGNLTYYFPTKHALVKALKGGRAYCGLAGVEGIGHFPIREGHGSDRISQRCGLKSAFDKCHASLDERELHSQNESSVC